MGAFVALVMASVAPFAVWAAPPPLKVVGTRLVDQAGRLLRLRGVNCAGMEWSSDGDGHVLKTFQVALKGWHANLVRLPLAQDRWFGKAPGQMGGGAGCRALTRELVDFCNTNGSYIILDLHWSDAGEWGKHIGQHQLPDQNSVAFWKDCASTFKDNPAVLFDLYNEPQEVSWDMWLNGGQVTETEDKTGARLAYHSPGMQALVDAIRETGARNVLLAGGVNWAYEVVGLAEGHALSDPRGNGVVYAVHPYPHGTRE